MLTIGKLGAGQEAYYLDKIAQGAEDYYSGEGEAEGRWTGSAAAELGLEGDVGAEQLTAMLSSASRRASSRSVFAFALRDRPQLLRVHDHDPGDMGAQDAGDRLGAAGRLERHLVVAAEALGKELELRAAGTDPPRGADPAVL
jgi:TrwC relaxase